jgi:hypothetical protein
MAPVLRNVFYRPAEHKSLSLSLYFMTDIRVAHLDDCPVDHLHSKNKNSCF